MATTEAAARAAFEARAWSEAYARLAAADAGSPLPPDDLVLLAVAAFLAGHDAESVAVQERAFHALLDDGRPLPAVRCAFWLAIVLANAGEQARAAGWLARAERLVDECGRDCAEAGYLLSARARQLAPADPAGAAEMFAEAVALGQRHHDPELIVLARMGRGRTLLHLGKVADGVALLDEAMVAVTAGEVGPMLTGIVYCTVIDACRVTFDLRRAREWTEALTRWCEAQPDLVPFRGECQVHRVHVMAVQGAWRDALAEAARTCARLSDPPGQPAAGAAHYERAELYRLRGELAAAEDAYQLAAAAGQDPQPGLGLLRLAQGRVPAAVAGLRRAVDEAARPLARPELLAALTEALLAAGDLAGARAACDELAELAREVRVPALSAMSAYATASLLLADGSGPAAALGSARAAWAAWREAESPYEAARSRVLVGLACRELGDEDAARMEFDAAARTFRSLPAAPGLKRLRRLGALGPDDGGTGSLTAREVEVLRLVAAGHTNRAIAAALVLSEKTVARHVANIFTKLDVSSRAAATAYAYEHRLV